MVDATATVITDKLKQLKDLIAKVKLDDFEFGNFKALFFGRHLYQPLIHLGKGAVKVSPVALNKGEKNFVEHLRSFYETEVKFFEDRQLYLLRNMSRGRGIGFFEAGNFHPDFIVWLLVGAKQYVTFVDPKGILRSGDNGPSHSASLSSMALAMSLATVAMVSGYDSVMAALRESARSRTSGFNSEPACSPPDPQPQSGRIPHQPTASDHTLSSLVKR